MLDYNDVKRFYADKLARDFDGTGRVESAFYHTMKMVYLKGVEDGKLQAEFKERGLGPIAGVLDQSVPRPPLGYTTEELEHDNPHNQWMHE